MYNADEAMRRYVYAMQQRFRAPIPVPYDPSKPVTHELGMDEKDRDPWIKQREPIKIVDIDGKIIDCNVVSLADFKKQCQDYMDSTGIVSPIDLPTKYGESKEGINRLIRNIHNDHQNLQALSEDSFDELIQSSANSLVYDSLDVIKHKVKLTPQAELHVLQVLNDVVELTAHTVCEYNQVMHDTGMNYAYPELVIDSFVSAGEEIDRHILKLWDDIST
ncbi:hypothetical protein PHABIO_369 [Pseudomonas phage Phabio]|uniref:Uncharacterized protein n=1 Tax=Pseudomonas phage Phabio TaxID=2006668 RepID=A0A1Y0SUH3_9CAUD|nr:hypothetical protein MZD05_gp369 [Pseudomonas phage Phabio]ARV77000.1 hypothetical protein PHABIO_369 [Pseudomonas phage Phabio]